MRQNPKTRARRYAAQRIYLALACGACKLGAVAMALLGLMAFVGVVYMTVRLLLGLGLMFGCLLGINTCCGRWFALAERRRLLDERIARSARNP